MNVALTGATGFIGSHVLGPRGTQRHEHDPEVIDDWSASAASGRHGGRG